MKRLSCPHCGHAFHLKDPEVALFAMSRVCPACSGHFIYGMRWSLFLLLFVPMVLVSIYLREWIGGWAPVPGVLIVVFFSVRLVKAADDDIAEQRAHLEREAAKAAAESAEEPAPPKSDEH